MSLKVGVVGATGMVGEVFMDILQKSPLPISELRPFASENSKGKKIPFKNSEAEIQTLTEGCFDGLDLVFFSSGDDISKEWAPKAEQAGAFAVDNSAAFRMNPNYPLVVPEVNSHLLPGKDKPTIIANPNCSTIQMVVALKALKPFGLKSVKVATYQAVSGSGKAGKEELLAQTAAELNGQDAPQPSTYPHSIAFNCLPHIGSFNEDGYCSEEVKMIKETKKILELPNLPVSAFTVRIPALNGHSEAVWVTLDKEVTKTEIEEAFNSMEGLVYIPQTNPQDYPHTKTANGQNPVYVGRLHQDMEDKNTWLMWIVADNILKGAALNGLQIAEKLFL